MYLKSIEINGFKSFANKIVFSFEHGFTGIVGPNGSGKSNVADAVRWVLGEQSAKQLRGAKMEDVIFSGTENRKPLGYAYVAITMDNSDHSLALDFDEVVVARRVYRSGESEYLLNGSPCRLKDVTTLFFDTGVGKEGYSIIGQGQIDKILSSKPDDRRELFDEAAGIVKYKKNKAATEKSLEAERENLSRVNDILSELTKQVGPLKRQSEVAKEFLAFKDELKELDVNVFLLENDKLRDDKEEVEKNLGIVEGDLEETKNAFEGTKKEYEESETENERLQKELDEKKNDITEIKLANEKCEGEVKVFAEQINTAKANDQHIGNRLGQIKNALEQKKLEKDKLYEEKALIDEEMDGIDDKENEADDALSNVIDQKNAIEEEMESLRAQIIESASESANLKAKVGRYDQMLEYIAKQKAELTSQKIERHAFSQDQQVEIDKKKQEYDELQKKIAFNQGEIEKNNRISEELAGKIASNKSTMEQVEREFHRTNSRLETLRNMTERYEGYGNSIKRVMEQKKNNNGLVGVVADIIQVNKQYEIAVETALGGSIQNIVTKDESTAKKMIGFLKENKFGRATFLPLTSIAGKTVFTKKEALKEKGVVGLASTLVSIDEKYKSVTEYLLGRTIVVDTIDNAIKLARKFAYSLRIVTLEGESLNPGGSMTGGTFKNMSNLLSRRREITDMEQELLNHRTMMENLKGKDGELHQKKFEIKEVLYELNENQQSYQLDENTIVLNLKQLKERLEEATQVLANVNRELEELDKQVISIDEQKKALFDGNEKHEEIKSEIEEKIEVLEKKLQSIAEEEKLANDTVTQIKMEFASIQQKNSYIVADIKRIKSEEAVLNEEAADLTKDVSKAVYEIAEISAKIDKMKEQISEGNEAQEKIQAEITQLTKTKEEFARVHRAIFEKREELNTRMNQLDKDQFRLTANKEKLDENLSSLSEYMWVEYELTYHTALALRNQELMDLRVLKKSLGEVKSKIKGLGDVNVNAIEDYKEVSQRYEFLSGQHDDIVKSEQNLLQVIEELDVAMRKQFSEKFQEIQVMFKKVFIELFGGGKADLSLIEEEDVLEAGIRINAQPPGKKLQNMMQLSGGEKALTAIALLFAIQNLKPSPFCLLDEIEAALDDANVDRFAHYLHKLTNHTQFIVITHRRGTMTSADVLYGITMQEKGVSTLVSVNLIEDELDKQNRKE